MNKYFDGCRDEQEIKTRYRDLAKKHHPDLGGDTETMKAVNEAYEQALKGAYRKAGMEEEKVNARWAMDEEIAAMAMKDLRLQKDLQVEEQTGFLMEPSPEEKKVVTNYDTMLEKMATFLRNSFNREDLTILAKVLTPVAKVNIDKIDDMILHLNKIKRALVQSDSTSQVVQMKIAV